MHPKPLPSADVVRKLVNYDPETGIFTWHKRYGGRVKPGGIAGRIKADGYWRIQVAGQSCPAHRLAFLFMTGSDPKGWVDHINRDKADNRWRNLRDCTQAENLWNIATVDLHTRRKVSSRYTGVSRKRMKAGGHRWNAMIMKHGKHYWLGSYATEEEARDAYLEAKKRLHDIR